MIILHSIVPKFLTGKTEPDFQIHLSRFKPRGRLSLNAEAESENEVEPVESIVQTTVDPRDNDVTEPTPRTSFVPQENKLMVDTTWRHGDNILFLQIFFYKDSKIN